LQTWVTICCMPCEALHPPGILWSPNNSALHAKLRSKAVDWRIAHRMNVFLRRSPRRRESRHLQRRSSCWMSFWPCLASAQTAIRCLSSSGTLLQRRGHGRRSEKMGKKSLEPHKEPSVEALGGREPQSAILAAPRQS
jgi:hypothetical protein